jgi:hypothetical protein
LQNQKKERVFIYIKLNSSTMILPKKDILVFILLLSISFVSVYFTSAVINRMVFLLLLIAVYRTKNDYIYLVWFFIINDAPGRLFTAGEFVVEARIPLYPVLSGVSVSFQELFIFIYVIKYFQHRLHSPFILINAFKWYLLIGLLYVAYSFIIGIDYDNMIMTWRNIFPWCLVFIIPAFIDDRETLIKTGYLLFPVVLFAFASEIFVYITGTYFDNYLRGVETGQSWILKEGRLSRSYSAVYITLISVILAFYLSLTHARITSKNYLYIIIFLGYLTVVLTGMRGFIIAFSLLYLGALLLYVSSRKITGVIRLATVAVVFLILVIMLYPGVQQQIYLAFQRVATVGAIVEGDLTAEGTLSRIDVRGPRVMKKFLENPILGWGFSNQYYKYQDGHVGHHNILLNAGVVGYIYMNGLFIYLCLTIWMIARNRKISIHEGNAVHIFLVGLVAVYVIHSSSTQFWGYTLSIYKTLVFGFFFASVNAIYSHHINNDDLSS